MDVAAFHSASCNVAFARKYAAAGRIGRREGGDGINKAIRAAGVESVPGAQGKNIAPQGSYASVLRHRTHSLIRDLGISNLRRSAREAGMPLDAPVGDLP